MESEKNKEVETCKACTTEPYSTIRHIVDGDDNIHNFDLFPDGTLMVHVSMRNGSPCSGYRIGQLKYCPRCGREFK